MTSTIGPLAVLGWLLLMLVVAGAAVLSVLAARTASSAGGRVLLAVATALLGAGVVIAALVAPIPQAVTVLLTVGVLVTAVAGGDPATQWVLRKQKIEGKPEAWPGGQLIGLLERFAVAGSIVAGFPEALAVIVAIKGVGRFSELDNSAVRERFIIGTLISWIWASAAACVVLLART